MGFNISGHKKFGAKPSGPAEPVTIKASTNQVVHLKMPYLTPRAGEIRSAVNFKVLTDQGTRIYFFNPADETWTNISLESTEANPVLSAPPVEAVEKAYNVLSRCPAVSKVTIVDDNDQPINMAQVRAICDSCSRARSESADVCAGQGHELHLARGAGDGRCG